MYGGEHLNILICFLPLNVVRVLGFFPSLSYRNSKSESSFGCIVAVGIHLFGVGVWLIFEIGINKKGIPGHRKATRGNEQLVDLNC